MKFQINRLEYKINYYEPELFSFISLREFDTKINRNGKIILKCHRFLLLKRKGREYDDFRFGMN